MKRLNFIKLIVLSIFLIYPNRGSPQPATEVDLKFIGEGRRSGEESTSFESHLQVSDYWNDPKTVRWLFKSFSTYATDRNLTRIDEVFTDWKGENLFFSFGKRRINWGTAMAFNPVNVIVPPRDPLNPKQETEGQPIAWFNSNLRGITTDIIFTRNFDKDWHSDLNRWGARSGFMLGDWDLAGYYFDGEANYERMLGLSLSTNLIPGVTLYSEAAGFNHNYVQAVIGSNIIFSPESFLSFFSGDAGLTLELYYNGGINRFYFLETYRNTFKERFTIELSGLTAQDLSLSLQGQIQYYLSDFYTMRTKLTHNQGGNTPTSDIIEVSLEINF